MSYHNELESMAMESPSAIAVRQKQARKELIAERNKLRAAVVLKKESSTLKILKAALHAVNTNSFAAYKLRHIRYAFFQSHGLSANRAYPKYDKMVTTRGDSTPVSKWTPVTFSHFVTQ